MAERVDRLETPERVDLEVNYAAVGSRALAQVIDVAILIVVWSISAATILLFQPAVGTWAAVLIFAVSFLLFWFYFAVFEAVWQGQTPGKRIVGVRVQKLGGYPIGWTEALLRNFLRPVDALVAYAVGLVVMMLTARSQRVGDLVAGTVVVHESRAGMAELERIGYRVGARDDSLAPTLELSTTEYEVLHDFIGRRGGLDRVAADRIQTRLAATLRRRLAERGSTGAGWDALSDEAFLLRVDAAYRGEGERTAPSVPAAATEESS